MFTSVANLNSVECMYSKGVFIIYGEGGGAGKWGNGTFGTFCTPLNDEG